MRRARRSFSLEFKLEAVRLVTEEGRSVVAVARDIDVRPEQVRAWKRHFQETGLVTAPPVSDHPEEENRRLRRELEVVRQERDFLKKAVAFFAKGSA
jgi:transposase